MQVEAIPRRSGIRGHPKWSGERAGGLEEPAGSAWRGERVPTGQSSGGVTGAVRGKGDEYKGRP